MRRAFIQMGFLLLLVFFFTGKLMAWAQDEPPLPSGLDKKSSEELEEPFLPEGLGESIDDQPTLGQEPGSISLPFNFSGFWEGRMGVRTQEDPHEKDFPMGETRLQLQMEKAWESASLHLTTDFLYDPVLNDHKVQLENGNGFLDMREASVLLRPWDFTDIEVGRQVLTWGTGDLIFINDLFPKDWKSFFIGRDPEYLKVPSDAVKLSLFLTFFSIDLVYTPRFDADRYIDGTRISFYNFSLGRRSGRDALVQVEQPDDWFEDDEMAWRLYQTIGGYELAIYGYQGFWKSPGGIDPSSGKALFPGLSVYGVSLRGAVGKGIANIEGGYYDSSEDRGGENPGIRNSEVRFLLGYEQEAAQNFTVGLQYYLEHILKHGAYRRTLPPGSPVADEDRHVLTVRLTRLCMNQNLRLSIFTFYSPSDQDTYLRSKIHFKVDDHWSVEAGGNLFFGKADHSFFGQFGKNNNLYAGIRYGF